MALVIEWLSGVSANAVVDELRLAWVRGGEVLDIVDVAAVDEELGAVVALLTHCLDVLVLLHY